MTKELIKRINSIPPLPETFVKINKICNDPNGTVEELTKVVEEDPMLVANILKTVNSPLYGLRIEIFNVAQAVALLGILEIKTLSTMFFIRKLLKIDIEPYNIEPEKFAIICNIQGALIKNWIKNMPKDRRDILFTAALLQETGKVLIADVVVRNNETFKFQADLEAMVNVAQVEKIYVDATAGEVTAAIFEHWGFDEYFTNIVRYSDDPLKAKEDYKTFSSYLNIAKTVCAINAPLSQRNITIALNHTKQFGLDENKLNEAINYIKEKYQEQL